MRLKKQQKIQAALAAAGPIVPPPALEAPLAAPPSTAPVDNGDTDMVELTAPTPPSYDAAAEHRPGFTPPDAQASFESFALQNNGDDIGQPEFSVNKYINRQLRDYQRQGVEFMWERYRQGKGGILGDDMGLVLLILLPRLVVLFTDFTFPTDWERPSRSSPSSRPS